MGNSSLAIGFLVPIYGGDMLYLDQLFTLENCFLMPPIEGMWRLAKFCPKNDILLFDVLSSLCEMCQFLKKY